MVTSQMFNESEDPQLSCDRDRSLPDCFEDSNTLSQRPESISVDCDVTSPVWDISNEHPLATNSTCNVLRDPMSDITNVPNTSCGSKISQVVVDNVNASNRSTRFFPATNQFDADITEDSIDLSCDRHTCQEASRPATCQRLESHSTEELNVSSRRPLRNTVTSPISVSGDDHESSIRRGSYGSDNIRTSRSPLPNSQRLNSSIPSDRSRSIHVARGTVRNESTRRENRRDVLYDNLSELVRTTEESIRANLRDYSQNQTPSTSNLEKEHFILFLQSGIENMSNEKFREFRNKVLQTFLDVTNTI